MVCEMQSSVTMPLEPMQRLIQCPALLLLYSLYDLACCHCDKHPGEGLHKWLNSNVVCRVELLLQHQLRGQCEVAVIPAAAVVAAIAVLVPQVEVSPLTPAGLEICMS